MIEANNPNLKSFIEMDKDHHFSIQNLPFGIFSDEQNPQRRLGVAIGDFILDLAACAKHGLLKNLPIDEQGFKQPHLNGFMELGREKTRLIRNAISHLLREDNPELRDNPTLQQQLLVPQKRATMHLPVKIAGYTDFYSSKEHATNIGKLFRDKDNPLLPNWVHIPVAYDGRAGSVVVSGESIKRPHGQLKPDAQQPPIFSASRALDVEVEMGLFVGEGSTLGQAIDITQAPQHVFGMVLLNDWSARDIQKWEYVPLGPFLGKNFSTSISPWVVTLDALEPFMVPSPQQDPEPLPYLRRQQDLGIDIQLQLAIQTSNMASPQTVATTNFKHMYWDIAQQLTHHSINGCAMHTGDLLGSGTISSNQPNGYGSLIELTQGGKKPLRLNNGEERVFLKDGDSAVISGFCQGDGYRVGFGEVVGTISPAM